jgi:hypothetical protein
VDLRTYFTKYNEMDRRWKIIIFLTHLFNRIPVISVFAVRITLIFTSKIHAINTLKMGALLRINVMLP